MFIAVYFKIFCINIDLNTILGFGRFSTWTHGLVRKSGRLSGRPKLGSFTNTIDNPLVVDPDSSETQTSKVKRLPKITKGKSLFTDNANDEVLDSPDHSDSNPILKRKNARKDTKGKSCTTDYADDEDFVVSNQSECNDVLKRKKSPIPVAPKDAKSKKPRKTNSTPTKAPSVKWHGIRTRSSPIQFFKCIQNLRPNQKEAVRKIGFGQLLTFRVDGIPAKLAHFVVDNFRPKSMHIKVGRRLINVDCDAIHKLLGVPCGEIKLPTLNQLGVRDPQVTQWRSMYPGRFVAPTQLVRNIKNSHDQDSFFFRMDFLLLFLSVMVECLSQGRIKKKVLDYITHDMEWSKINWCEYIVQAMKNCKKNWRRQDTTSSFYGPLTILTLLYVDSFECEGINFDGSQNAITFWTMSKLRKRQKLEIKKRGFGLGKFKGLSDVVNDGSKEMIEADVVLTLSEKVSDVHKVLDELATHKLHVEDSLVKLLAEYPQSIEVNLLKEKYQLLLEKSILSPQDTAPEKQDGLNANSHEHSIQLHQDDIHEDDAYSVEEDSAESDSAESDSAESDSVESDIGELDAGESYSTESHSSESDNVNDLNVDASQKVLKRKNEESVVAHNSEDALNLVNKDLGEDFDDIESMEHDSQAYSDVNPGLSTEGATVRFDYDTSDFVEVTNYKDSIVVLKNSDKSNDAHGDQAGDDPVISKDNDPVSVLKTSDQDGVYARDDPVKTKDNDSVVVLKNSDKSNDAHGDQAGDDPVISKDNDPVSVLKTSDQDGVYARDDPVKTKDNANEASELKDSSGGKEEKMEISDFELDGNNSVPPNDDERVCDVHAEYDDNHLALTNVGIDDDDQDFLSPDSIAAIPISAVPSVELVQQVAMELNSRRINPHRHVLPADALRSPWFNRGVELSQPITNEERKI
ncbi:hypothetical protein SSX86_023887 [Deinandra increscens subsp. villosa]|uniref:Uncharacterized protein n=1 Tax=Deinandra increscens subsp. villosa TaxID=3103831 RepID=A0AAP0CM44_9ASTR